MPLCGTMRAHEEREPRRVQEGDVRQVEVSRPFRPRRVARAGSTWRGSSRVDLAVDREDARVVVHLLVDGDARNGQPAAHGSRPTPAREPSLPRPQDVAIGVETPRSRRGGSGPVAGHAASVFEVVSDPPGAGVGSTPGSCPDEHRAMNSPTTRAAAAARGRSTSSAVPRQRCRGALVRRRFASGHRPEKHEEQVDLSVVADGLGGDPRVRARPLHMPRPRRGAGRTPRSRRAPVADRRGRRRVAMPGPRVVALEVAVGEPLHRCLGEEIPLASRPWRHGPA